ncbi:MAG: transposase [Acidobacteriaceae bacterium]|nr:transposase [Acidobacteriaceae bacterium]
MKRKQFSEEQIVNALKQLEGGRTAEDIGREIGVSKHTIYGWNKKYGGLSSDDARRLRHLEEENRRLKHIVADLTLDREVLKGVIEKNGWSS